MICLLFYHDRDALGRDTAFIDRLLTMFGIIPIVIDPALEEATHYDAHFYPSLAEAVADDRWAGFSWVWLDADGDSDLESFQHPASEVIYCVGSDAAGFSGEVYPGQRVKLPVDMIDDETYASLVVPVLCGHMRWGA